MTKVASHSNGGKKAGFFSEGSVTIGYPYGKKNETLTLFHHKYQFQEDLRPGYILDFIIGKYFF